MCGYYGSRASNVLHGSFINQRFFSLEFSPQLAAMMGLEERRKGEETDV